MNQFLYSKDGKVTVFLTESKGQKFKGVAKCSNTDEYKKEIGDRLAMCRADLEIRKRDLEEVRRAKIILKEIINNLDKSQSKLWMQWYQDACRVEKIHLEYKRNLLVQINNLSHGIIK